MQPLMVAFSFINMAEIGTNISKAVELLKQNQCVAIPTETVYGLAANALNPEACIKIFEIKNRPSFDPLIVHTYSLNEVKKLVCAIPDAAYKLAEKFWPGPLTLILKKQAIIPDIVSSGLQTVGIRIPNQSLTLQLLKQLPFPLAAPSANPFGYVSPTTPLHVNEQLGHKIDYILDGGPCSVGIESTIISFEFDKPRVLRLGGIAIEEITKLIGPVEFSIHQSSNPTAPGQTDSHYAPLKKLTLVSAMQMEELLKKDSNQFIYICFSKTFTQLKQDTILPLTTTESLTEAAANLFAMLRKADASNYPQIVAEIVPDVGLGCAINDRLKRASTKR
jgi:L-threonylcarbamoyladenylate synthase